MRKMEYTTVPVFVVQANSRRISENADYLKLHLFPSCKVVLIIYEKKDN